MSEADCGPSPRLRAAISADLAPVRRLAPPAVRGLLLLPLAALLLVAAPLAVGFRDMLALGWQWSWGASVLQLGVGLLLTTAALRESVPGRSRSRAALTVLAAMPIVLITTIAVASWQRSPVLITGSRVLIGAICLTSSTITALPAAAVTIWLAVRAYPTRPTVTGGLAGLGAGLMADAGWRLFCHFSEPSHVLATHLGGVLLTAALGAVAARRLRR